MSYETFISTLRFVDAVLAALVFGLLVNRGRRFWDDYDFSQKWMYVSFILYTLAVSYTSFELWAQDTDVGFRSYVVLVANLVALFGLWKFRGSIILGQPDDRHPTLR